VKGFNVSGLGGRWKGWPGLFRRQSAGSG